MVAYRYTDVDTRTVYSVQRGLVDQAGKIVKFWANEAGTTPIDIGLWSSATPDTPGASTGSNQLTVRADGQWPEMWDRGGALDHMWIQVGTVEDPGALYRVYCDADQRDDALAARIATLEGASATAVALTAEATARAAADSAEATTRATADSALSGLITDEATARANADTAEAALRMSGDAASVSTAAADATAKVAAEATARANAVLDAIATAAAYAAEQALAARNFAIQRGNHTGTQSADTLTDGTAIKAFLAAERTKLSGIATGATANATDAQLRDRSTHTGTQSVATITGLGGAAILNVGKAAGTVAAGDDSRLFAAGILVSEQAGATPLAKLQAAVTASAALGTWALVDAAFSIAGTVSVPGGARIDGYRGTVTQLTDLTPSLQIDNVSDVIIRGFRAIGKGADYINSSAVQAAAAIYVSGTSSKVRIGFCDLQNHAGAGVRTGNATSDVKVFSCDIVGPGSPTIGGTANNFGMGVLAGDGAQSWSVTHCDISQYAQGINSGDGDNVRIIGNYIHDIVGQHGIYIDTTGNLVISGNVIVTTGLAGIKVQIANNTVGQDCDQVSITGNTITGSGSHGILLGKVVAGSRQFRNVTVTGNSISTSGAGGDGVNISGVIGGVFTGNVIANARNGFSATDCAELTVGPNRFKTLQNSGIVFTNVTDSEIFRNRIIGPASLDVVSSEYGIYISGTSAAITIDGNIVSDSAAHMKYGLFIASTVTQSTCVVRNNDLSGATDYGARLDSAQSIKEWSNNVCSGTLGDILNFPSGMTIKGAPTTYTGTAAPTSGTWVRGQVVWNSTPSQLGTLGWVCTASGAPGTWSPFGERQSVWSGPALNNLKGATFDPLIANAGVGTTTAGVLLVAKVQMERGSSISSVDYVVTGAGSGLTAGQNLIGIYSSAGALIGTSVDQTTNFGSTGQKSATISPATAAVAVGDWVFVVLLWNGSVSPQLRGVSSTASWVNIGLGSNFRFATGGTGLTALPDPLPALAASAQSPYFSVR